MFAHGLLASYEGAGFAVYLTSEDFYGVSKGHVLLFVLPFQGYASKHVNAKLLFEKVNKVLTLSKVCIFVKAAELVLMVFLKIKCA